MIQWKKFKEEEPDEGNRILICYKEQCFIYEVVYRKDEGGQQEFIDNYGENFYPTDSLYWARLNYPIENEYEGTEYILGD